MTSRVIRFGDDLVGLGMLALLLLALAAGEADARRDTLLPEAGNALSAPAALPDLGFRSDGE